MGSLRRAVILDDQQLFADSFSLLLERYTIFDQVNSFNEIDDFMDFFKAYGNKEIFVFLDYYLAKGNGLSVFSDIKRLNKKAFCIFVTSATSPNILHTILQYQPHAILSKSCSLDEILNSTKEILEGKIYIDPIVQSILEQQDKNKINFTTREIEILHCFKDGLNVLQTAEKMFLSRHTIMAHRRNMMAKTNSNSITQLLKATQDLEII